VTAIDGRLKPEIFFLHGRLRWTLLLKERYGDSFCGRGSNTQPSNWEADTLPQGYRHTINSSNIGRIALQSLKFTSSAVDLNFAQIKHTCKSQPQHWLLTKSNLQISKWTGKHRATCISTYCCSNWSELNRVHEIISKCIRQHQRPWITRMSSCRQKGDDTGTVKKCARACRDVRQ